MKLRVSFGIFGRGVAMGMADIVPGVSGGTIAMITGIYERLVRGISNLGFAKVRDESGETRRKLKKIDLDLFVPLVIGIAIAIILMSNVILYLLDHQPSPTYAFFFAVILTSAFVFLRQKGVLTFFNGIYVIVGFLATFALVNSGVLELGHEPYIIFFAGMVAVCAMILPGISGALILLFLGQYEYMLDALRSLSWLDIVLFITGAVIGLLAFSRLLNHLLKNYRNSTIAFLIGLMLGALKLPYDNIAITSTNLLPVLIAAAAGFLLIAIMELELRSRKRKA
ncbi:MAG: hypothetical protein AYK23_02290 [Candidatus Proteinoplasmatales archaeon SG8-5]|nr:MAG: hypothetical protein AYK23_02290 [Candidatus Proteinoplasmatales archaeon SG8-5]